MGELLHFKITHHALNLYGHCDGACDKQKNTLSTSA
jgi:Fur family ferric uptake transcriptional regulator